MATCKGCGRVSKCPRAPNWKNFMLCYSCYCSKILQKKPEHGTGNRYGNETELVIFAAPETKHLSTPKQS